MRVVICGDTHFGAVFGLGKSMPDGVNTRVRDYENSFNRIVDYCISESIDVFIQTGDLFESRNPLPEHMSIVDSCIKRLSNAGILTIIIMGNHDYRRSGVNFSSSITSLASNDYLNVRIILEPQVVTVDNGGDSINILLVPYRDKRMYGGGTSHEASAGYNRHMESMIDDISNDNPTIAVGHNFYYEGSYNDYGGAEILADAKSFDGCEMIAMGHQHNFRIVRKKSPMTIYTGSMDKLNFGDSNIDKYFIDYDSLNKKINFKKVQSRRLIDASIDLVGIPISDIDEKLTSIVDDIDASDSIVRIRVRVDESSSSAVNKNYIEDKLYSSGAFFVSKVMVEPISERIVRDLSVLNYNNDYDMFSAFVNSQDINDDLKKSILKCGKEVME
jgi:exonuclease SbcD